MISFCLALTDLGNNFSTQAELHLWRKMLESPVNLQSLLFTSYHLQQRWEFKATFCSLARCSSNGAAGVEETPLFSPRQVGFRVGIGGIFLKNTDKNGKRKRTTQQVEKAWQGRGQPPWQILAGRGSMLFVQLCQGLGSYGQAQKQIFPFVQKESRLSA